MPEAEGLDPLIVRNHWLKEAFLWQSGLLKTLRKGEYDAIVMLGSWLYVSSWAAALQAKLARTPVLYWTHGWKEPEPNLQGFLRRRFFKLGKKLLLYGHRAAEIGATYGWADDDLVVIGNSLPMPDKNQTVDPWVASQLDDPSLPTAIWISRVIQEKAPDMAVEAIALAAERGTPINMIVIGGGPDEEAMKTLATARCPGRVHFCGPVHDQRELASIFAVGAVTVVPDYGGLSIPHSLIHGVPVVANDDPPANGPDYEYLYPESNGSTFPRGDVNAFTDQVLRWSFDEPMSTERKQAIEDRAREDASPILGAERIFTAIRGCL